MATDAESAAAEIQTALAPKQQPDTPQELHDFPWLRRGADQPSGEQPTEQELHDFPWLKRQQEEQPQAQQPAISHDVIKSVVAAYDQTRNPLEWAEDVAKGQIKASPLSIIPRMAEVAGPRMVEDVAGIAGAALRTFGTAESGIQPPNLQGMSVDQVKAIREQMLAQRDDLSKHQDQIISSGTPDSSSLYTYLQATQGLDQRIKEADAIIASGKPQVGPSGTTNPVAAGITYAGRTVEPAVSKFLDKYAPTDQEFANSLPGQIAKYGADGVVMGGLSALTAPVSGPIGGVVIGGLMMGNQAYDDAKAHGASDEVADRAGLLTSLSSGATIAALGPVVGGLAKSFAGLTAKQGMNALVQAGVYTTARLGGAGAEFGVINYEQNAIAKLTGYDPNRKLDEGFWQNFWTGVMFEGVHLATSDIPHINRMFKPDVTVRNKDATPAQTGEQTQTPVTPSPAATQPAPTAPTTVEQQATAAAQTAATQTPEQTIAQANPEAELEKFMTQMKGQQPQPERGFVQVGGTPPTYTGPERPARPTLQLGAPEAAAEQTPSERIYSAWQQLSTETGRSNVFISDLINRSGLPAEEVKAWLEEQGARRGVIDLNEGDIGAARQIGKGESVQMAGRARVYADLSRLQPAAAETRDAAAMPPAATEHGAEPVPSNTPGPSTTVEAPQHAAPVTAVGDAAERLVDPQMRQAAKDDPEGIAAMQIAKVRTALTRMSPEQRAIYENPAVTEIKNVTGGGNENPSVFADEDGHVVPWNQLPDGPAVKNPDGKIYVAGLHTGAQLAAGGPEAGQVAGMVKGGVFYPHVPKPLFSGIVDTSRAEPLTADNFGNNLLIRKGLTRETAPRAASSTAGVPEAPTAEHPEPQPENTSPQRRAWYEGEEMASLPPVARPEPEDRVIGPADVKREVNTAQEQMGMEDHLKYVASVEDLPDHVKSGLTEGERGGTAQVVRDNKLGDIYVIGDRFDSLNDLRRKIVEETLPYTYRNVTKVGLTHDNTDPRTGHYDVLADRPILNTHAIISHETPYAEASRALMEEADVHQGISKLLGPRNGPVYTGVMEQLLQNFRRLGLVDKLAQLRGYQNAQHMAQAYGVPKWETDPRQANKFTEELAAGYSRNFRNINELMRDGPTWWQNGLRRLNNSIRQFLGLRLSDYDVQSLLVDSAAALRRAKMDDHAAQFHGIGDAAKADMHEFQMASLPPERTATEAGETADIGTELVKGKIRNLQATLRPGEIIRAGALRKAMDNTHGLQERMNLLNRQPAVTNRQGHGEVMQAAKRIFDEDFHGNVHEALDYLINNAATEGPGANNSMLVKVVDREVDRQIEQLDKAGRTQQANILRAKLDRMNIEQLQRQTEAGREISALYDRTGSSVVAQHKRRIQEIQRNATEGSEGKRARGERATKALGEVKQATEKAAQSLRDKFVAMMQRTGRTDLLKSLPEQYTDDLVNQMRKLFADTGTESSTETLAPVEQAFDTFRRNIADIIREKAPKAPPAMKISPASTLNELMTNHSWYAEAWARTIQDLNEHNPALAQRFADVADGPIGEPLANKLAAEQGTKLSDLIYNHYSVNDRLTTDLAREIASKTDIHPLEAEQLTNHLDKLFGDIIEKEQGKRLQAILDSVGGHFKPAKTEFERLLNHITIGGLDSKEWMNVIAPRFGIENITPEQEKGLRAAGDWMVKMQDYGLANTAIAQWARTTIGDLTENKNIPLAVRPAFDRLNYAINVIVSSLISNPLTHLPYWQAMAISEGINSAIHGIRTFRDTGDPKVFLSQVLGGVEGLKRGMREAGPIVRGGYKAEHELLPQYLSVMRSSPLDRVPVKYHNFAWYKYVRNALDAVSNIITRGGQYAVQQALAHHLAWEKGLSGQEAIDYAKELTMGSKENLAEADRRSHEIVDEMQALDPDHPISEDARRLVRESILDQLRTSSDDPDEAEQRLDTGRRAQRSATRAALRGDVYGFWGRVSKLASRMNVDHPEAKLVVPFVNVPFNLVNELSSWGPLGVWRSLKDLVPEEGKTAAMLEQVPFGLGEGVRAFIKDVPGMEKKLETGEFSQDAVRDLAWEQMVRGVVGGGVFAGAGALTALSLGNPNPPWKITYNGPSNYNAQQAEKGKGWIPHSIYLGDWAGPFKGWHSYENLPLRSVFAALGSLSDYYRYDRKPEDSDGNAALKAFFRMPSAWFSSTFGSPLQGLEVMLSNLVHSGGSADPQREFGQWLTQLVAAGATVPVGGAAARAAWRLKDPREFEANDMIGKTLRYIPIVNSLFLKPKLNIFGEAMQASPLEKIPEYSPTSGFLGTTLGHVIESDPVWDYLNRHPGIKLSLPGAHGNVAGIPMSPAETYEYHLKRGPELKAEIARAIADPRFRAMPVDEQNYLVHTVYEKIANRIGQAAVMRYRQAHPVTEEQVAGSRQAKLEALAKEIQSTRLAPEAEE